MPFDWKNAPDQSTPLDAATLEAAFAQERAEIEAAANSTYLPGQKEGATGRVAVNIQGDDTAIGPLWQSTPENGQMRLVVSRANLDPQAGPVEHNSYIIEPYTYGMGVSYGGIIQTNTACLAVGPMVQTTDVPSVLGPDWPGGIILLINEADTGGLFLTSKNGPNLPATALNRIIAETYTHEDGGPLQLVTRGGSGFDFLIGAPGTEVNLMEVDPTEVRINTALKVMGGVKINAATGPTGVTIATNTAGATAVLSFKPNGMAGSAWEFITDQYGEILLVDGPNGRNACVWVGRATSDASSMDVFGVLGLKNTQATTATAGSAAALPATPQGYFQIHDAAGTLRKVPYYV